jgi:hypothetical protein
MRRRSFLAVGGVTTLISFGVAVAIGCATNAAQEPDVPGADSGTGATTDGTVATGDTGAKDAAAAADTGTDAGAALDTGIDTGVLDPDTGPPAPVECVVTCDNAYGFGWGDATSLKTYNTAPASVVAGDIFNCPVGNGPEAYNIPAADAPPSAFLYAVAWADHSVTQGLIGQFKREGSPPLYTGDLNWQVCATGIDYNTSIVAQRPGPPLAEINAEIVKCNNGTGDPATSSAGWVNSLGAVTAGAIGHLAIGEDNSSPAGNFPIACQPTTLPDGGKTLGIDPVAKWMWYTSVPGGDAFRWSSQAHTRHFLIFRLSASRLPP